jgi:hypothetical protein
MLDLQERTRKSLSLLLALLICFPGYAQQEEKRNATRDAANRVLHNQDSSDLARENLRRVAASAGQIREVLVKDTGLMVELKRWVAKEATDNGQYVDDAGLTDTAIFDRLDRDVAFRAVATLLLQRYGYLMPTANPDSDYGKEHEFVLRERAKRMVQQEAQEDALSLQPQKPSTETARDACDPRDDEDCFEQPAGGSRRRARSTN